MKFLIVADMHLSYTSSILPIYQKDSMYTTRLQYIIDTVKWYENLAKEQNVDYIINLGDLTDSNILRAEELTALAEAYSCRNKDSIPELYIVGNHDTLTDDHRYNATSILRSIPGFTIFNEPTKIKLESNNDSKEVTFLPYMNWKNIDHEFLKKYNSDILFSHIDITGSSLYKAFGIDVGIDPNLLCMYFNNVYNGHIHLQERLECSKNNVWNVGSLTSSSFSDSNKYIPGAHIVDTTKNSFETIPNPYNILFRKFSINSITDLKTQLSKLDKTYRYVLRIDVPYSLKEEISKLLEKEEYIIANRLIINRKNIDISNNDVAQLEIVDKNNIKYKFVDFIKSFEDDTGKELKYPIKSYTDLISNI